MVLKTDLLYSKFESLPILERSWQKIAIYFIINFFLIMFGLQEVDAILMVIDYFIKYIVFIFVRSDINAAELAKLVYNYINIWFGLFSNIVFDCNLMFINEFWSSFCYYSKIKR